MSMVSVVTAEFRNLIFHILQTCCDNLRYVLFCKRGVGLVEAFVYSNVVCHLADTALVDAEVAKMHRNPNAFEEFVSLFDGFVGDFPFVELRVDTENVDAVFHKTRQCVLVLVAFVKDPSFNFKLSTLNFLMLPPPFEC